MKTFDRAGWILLISVLLASCGGADFTRADQQRQALDEAAAQIGMPAIVNFQEQRMMKDVYELRDKAITTYAYLKDANGPLRCYGQGIGFAIPYGTQYTAPTSPINGRPQAEPNGLFVPDTADASWYMMLDPEDGKLKAIETEPQMIVSQFKLPCIPLDAR